MAKFGSVTILVICLLAPPYAYAGPPMLTDDTGTPGNRKWEINIGVSVERNTFEDRFLIPLLDFNYGLGDRIQLKYEVPWVISSRKEGSTLAGPGNSVFGVKYRFLDEDKQGITVSVYPQLEFNNSESSADRGIVDKGTTLLLPFQLQKQIGWLGLNAELGYLFKRDEDEWLYGFVLSHKFDKIEVLGELHGVGPRNFKRHRDVVNFGVRWDFAQNKSLNASIGRSLHSPSEENPSLIAYVGIQFRL